MIDLGILMDNNTPGSKEATAKGCTCPVIDNAHGRGHLGDGDKYGFWIDTACPIHGSINPKKNTE